MLIALKALGVGPGCEVVIPAYDWGATLAVVQTLGASPVVAPINEAMVLNPSTLASFVTKKTKAIIVCHLVGLADVAAIKAVLSPDIYVIEDCARCFGANYDGRPTGTLGDLAVFSFGPGKTIDIGEGGMILARNWTLWERLVLVGTHPLRQMTAGLDDECPDALALRPHPLAAVLLVIALRRWAMNYPRGSQSFVAKDNNDCDANKGYDIASILVKKVRAG
jgi:dTDP-4-amino-4,6-dideoxygalactose transaminase